MLTSQELRRNKLHKVTKKESDLRNTHSYSLDLVQNLILFSFILIAGVIGQVKLV